MAAIISPTDSLKKATVIIDGIDDKKFRKLLSRIVQTLHKKDEHAFTNEEEEKLEAALALGRDDLQLVLTTCEFILQQAAYHILKPPRLRAELVELGLAGEKADTFVDVWTAAAKPVTDQLKQRTLAPKQLDDVKWRLNLTMASSENPKVKEPNAMFQLDLKDTDTLETDKVLLEFNHEELYKFYQQLETIQTQLDALT